MSSPKDCILPYGKEADKMFLEAKEEAKAFLDQASAFYLFVAIPGEGPERGGVFSESLISGNGLALRALFPEALKNLFQFAKDIPPSEGLRETMAVVEKARKGGMK